MDSNAKIILIAVAPLALMLLAAFASARVREWTAAQEQNASASDFIETIGALGTSVVGFIGISLMTTDGAELQGFLITFLAAPLLLYLGFFYPRALHANIRSLKERVELLERQISKA
jgi:hypothetical protein